jgi:hypothetical protein
MIIHHQGQSWEKNEKPIAEIDRDLRDLSDATVERYADQLDIEAMRGLKMEHWRFDQIRPMRARNEVARRRQIAAKQEQEQAQEKAQQAARQKRADDQEQADRRMLRLRWTGDDRSFEAAYPKLMEQLRIDRALGRDVGSSMPSPRVEF